MTEMTLFTIKEPNMIPYKQSTKLPGYIQFAVNHNVFHAWTPDAGLAGIMPYWYAITLANQMNAHGLTIPSKHQANLLLQSDLLNSPEFRYNIIGPAWFVCWLDDYAALEINPDTHTYSIREHASGLGKTAPIWFVEVPDV